MMLINTCRICLIIYRKFRPSPLCLSICWANQAKSLTREDRRGIKSGGGDGMEYKGIAPDD